MLLFSVIFPSGCAATALLHLFWLRRFRRGFRRPEVNLSQTDNELPSVLVVLSLRGADPFPGDCLRELFRQNYPTYDVRIVIDSRKDPAWPIVEKAIKACGAENVQVKTLKNRLDSCGLRMSSLIQEFHELDDSYQVAAWLDADTIPYWQYESARPTKC
ncbi:MAG: glycosyltransferase family 2 protein [Fuerstiella sp.]